VVWRMVWAVVVTPVRMVTEIVLVVSRGVVDGLTVQVELAGAPVQVKAAVRVVGSFVAGLRRRGKTAFWPLWVVTVVLPSAMRAKSTPVPVSGRVWGEVGELSVMVRVPVRGPAAVGVNASCRVQAAATARVAGQLSVPGTMAKSPVTVVLLMTRGRPPLLVRVTMGERAVMPTPVLGKLMAVVGERETPGGATPVPVSERVWVRYWSVTVRVPLAGPTAVGWKVTLIEQVAWALSELPQALTTLKSPVVI
jgi:hypothetical protein